MPLLYSLARSWAWEAVIFRCQTHPHEASADFRDNLGDTCLHWMVFGRPPLRAVQAVLAACPQTARTVNDAGQYALHVACSYRASAHVIEAVQEAYPIAAALPTKLGVYPIHILCDYGESSLNALKVLLRCPEGRASVVRIDPRFQRRPLLLLNGRKNLQVQLRETELLRNRRLRQRAIRQEKPVMGPLHELNWEERTWMQHELMEQLEDDIRPLRYTDFWKTASLLIVAEFLQTIEVTENDEPPKMPLFMLHNDNPIDGHDAVAAEVEAVIVQACVGNPECPPTLQEYAILLYEPLLLIPDKWGRCPLHSAARVYARCNGDASSQLLLRLLDARPEAAHVRDSNGCFPLSLALASRSDSEDGQRRCRESCWSDGLERLIDANPLALLEDDVGVLSTDPGRDAPDETDSISKYECINPFLFARLSSNTLFALFKANPMLLIHANKRIGL